LNRFSAPCQAVEDTIKFMLVRTADKNTEAGIIPSLKLFEAMTKLQ
jgi:hypothetical protein